ncbi:MAG: hypothetical protein ACR2G4_11395 [Pyrinomonadaceae bacterium]
MLVLGIRIYQLATHPLVFIFTAIWFVVRRAKRHTSISVGAKTIRWRICSKFIAFGEGNTAPVTHEVLRQAEEDPAKRPVVVRIGG